MKITRSAREEASAALLLSLLATPAASMLHCDNIVASGTKFDLSPLSGPHSVTVSRFDSGNYHNTTYTTDICRALKRKGDVDLEKQCFNGARVCAITRLIGPGDSKLDEVQHVVSIAGELSNHGGGPLDPEVTNLETSDSNSDFKKKGVRIIMNGGIDTISKRRQRAIIEFECNPDREGTEGEYSPEDKYESGNDPLRLRSVTNPLFYTTDDGEKPAEEIQLGDGKNASLVYVSYGPLSDKDNIDVLRLTWRTKHACPRSAGGSGGDASSHWGFFTWLVIIVFLGTAAYLIFGSWLNYNRYGARGWDLVPHGDTIRDVPYLLKDWTRRVLNTMQGSGSRGGYSAV